MSDIVLSRFFSNNVKLVADMCPRCYEESTEVKIISVNLAFLKHICKNVSDEYLILIKKLLPKQTKDYNTHLGFSEEEIKTSLIHVNQIKEIIDEKCNRIKHRKFEYIDNSFNGFSYIDTANSHTYHNNMTRASNSVTFKIHKRVSCRTTNKIKKETNNKHRRIQFLTVDSEYLNIHGDEGPVLYHSRYFTKPNNHIISNNSRMKIKQNRNFCQNNIETKVKIWNNIENKCPTTDKVGKIESTNEEDNKQKHHQTLQDANENNVDYESEYMKMLENNNLLGVLKKEIPKSPHNLIEESVYHDPWTLLIATIFLNRTSCMVARPYIFWFLIENPNPIKVINMYPRDLEKYFIKLGLQRTRAIQVWRMTFDYLYKKWKNPSELYGIGRYGDDAYRMFCLRDFSVVPKDRFLKIYKAWYEKIIKDEIG